MTTTTATSSTERPWHERVDDPQTSEDFALAAVAWATGNRSTNNEYTGMTHGENVALERATIATMDAARVNAFSAMALVLLATEER